MGTRNDLSLALSASSSVPPSCAAASSCSQGPVAHAWMVHAWMIALVLMASATVAGCATGGNDADAGGSPRDARVVDGETPPRDSGGRDGGDSGGGGLCSGVSCPPFQQCISGSCRPFPACAGDGTCPAGSVCHANRCVPSDVDVDGDGSPAGEDCDETNAARSPDLPEVCDSIDNDCDSTADDGDPATLCESDPVGGLCMEGVCGCPTNTFDFDRTVAGCECTAMPPVDQGQSCAAPIDLGNVSDAAPGQRMMVSGNLPSAGGTVWYRFRGVDSPDTTCDAFHVRVLMMENPDDAFEFTVFQGSCDMPGCDDGGYLDFERGTDLGMDVGGIATGECPCVPAAANMVGVTHCTDSSADFFVRVRRRADTTVSCASFTLEVSNGVY